MSKVIAMIPARMGSQRLRQKNLRELNGVPLISRAIAKCLKTDCFDEVWVNSENAVFGDIAADMGVGFHQRPEKLGDNQATSEQYIEEFLRNHECDLLVQVHSIAPLLGTGEVRSFVEAFRESECDVMLSCILDQIEVAYQDVPVNFTLAEKTNSQDLQPVQRITWSITGWTRSTYLAACDEGKCATYSGQVGYFPVSAISGHVIKTQQDLDIAAALLDIVGDEN